MIFKADAHLLTIKDPWCSVNYINKNNINVRN